jgi:hypothetical protein
MPNERYLVNKPDKEEWEKFPGKGARALAQLLGEYEMDTPALTRIYKSLGPRGMAEALLQRKAQQQRAQEMATQQLFGQYQHIVNPFERIQSNERLADSQLEQARALQEMQDARAAAGQQTSKDIAGMNLQGQMERTKSQLTQKQMQEQARQGRHDERMGLNRARFGFEQAKAGQQQTKSQANQARLEQQHDENLMAKLINASMLRTGSKDDGIIAYYQVKFPDKWAKLAGRQDLNKKQALALIQQDVAQMRQTAPAQQTMSVPPLAGKYPQQWASLQEKYAGNPQMAAAKFQEMVNTFGLE